MYSCVLYCILTVHPNHTMQTFSEWPQSGLADAYLSRNDDIPFAQVFWLIDRQFVFPPYFFVSSIWCWKLIKNLDFFFLNLSIYNEPWCINTIINFILYWSMSWCWQIVMECSLFLPSPGTARADNSFSRHFFYLTLFYSYATYVYCKYFQLILENKLFLYNFNLK